MNKFTHLMKDTANTAYRKEINQHEKLVMTGVIADPD
jgi:hypothetical protein